MEPVVVGIALGIAGAVAYKTVTGTADRLRGWYDASVKDSLGELVCVLALLGALLGVLYSRARH